MTKHRVFMCALLIIYAVGCEPLDRSAVKLPTATVFEEPDVIETEPSQRFPCPGGFLLWLGQTKVESHETAVNSMELRFRGATVLCGPVAEDSSPGIRPRFFAYSGVETGGCSRQDGDDAVRSSAEDLKRLLPIDSAKHVAYRCENQVERMVVIFEGSGEIHVQNKKYYTVLLVVFDDDLALKDRKDLISRIQFEFADVGSSDAVKIRE